MKGFLAIFLLLGIIYFHLESTAADEYHAATEIMAEIAEAPALDRRALKEMVVDHVPMMGAANGDCNSEATTCTIDSNGCYACLQAYDDAGCDDSPDNCGELGLSYCCAFGDDPACGTNTALIAWVECVIADTVTCDLGDDMCSGGSSVFPRHSTSLFVAVGLLGFVASSISAMAF